MDYIQVYQGGTPTVNVFLADSNGFPYNASGAVLYLSAKQDYSATENLFSLASTGLGAGLSGALTGMFGFHLTTGETSLCPGDYPAGLLLIDSSSGRNPIPIGYTVLPFVGP